MNSNNEDFYVSGFTTDRQRRGRKKRLGGHRHGGHLHTAGGRLRRDPRPYSRAQARDTFREAIDAACAVDAE